MLDLTEPQDDFTHALASTPPSNMADSRLVSWVVVSEWLNPDGTVGLTARTNATPWVAQGMMQYATDNGLVDVCTCGECDEDE